MGRNKRHWGTWEDMFADLGRVILTALKTNGADSSESEALPHGDVALSGLFLSPQILLNELGFDEGFITPLRKRYLQPLTSLLYPDCGGRCLDSHKAFVVKYDLNEDLELSYHYDNAEVTLNVSLGKSFTDGNLFFGDMRQVPVSETECTEVEHRVTEGLLHRGQHMHGALPISCGQRWNLIIWMRASQERNNLCPMCNRRPSLVEGDGFADGFTDYTCTRMAHAL